MEKASNSSWVHYCLQKEYYHCQYRSELQFVRPLIIERDVVWSVLALRLLQVRAIAPLRLRNGGARSSRRRLEHGKCWTTLRVAAVTVHDEFFF